MQRKGDWKILCSFHRHSAKELGNSHVPLRSIAKKERENFQFGSNEKEKVKGPANLRDLFTQEGTFPTQVKVKYKCKLGNKTVVYLAFLNNRSYCYIS